MFSVTYFQPSCVTVFYVPKERTQYGHLNMLLIFLSKKLNLWISKNAKCPESTPWIKTGLCPDFSQTIFGGHRFPPTRNYSYPADVWGHFLIATNGGWGARKETSGCQHILEGEQGD